ncbi:hypothetical protein PSN45_000544 [Yamadazyma tenuis]|uniref:Bul1 N-terminal domain-containing protein n=1 Tax=Candida tenuis (strain ATCC 10573 / BCRC 21748 / CBS 615 / JCM 9827 / NBRC 10315 / NRRL Y-1498 / VKM Y-70) TaxID=590646 RepID=G3B9B0_CANTC|nr:uncharacterized protein CANTEDRAFT_109229 [Yamadazyma tenuis ATCC 10573]EGV61855.1 hypothetical protein CANTEDRAFT_109229 [Yamadazyma tenuis ATCC 10573]WEJ93084.1 hypothetical protein PSN45_000544 [Yamadazyma tenuis]
MSTRKNSKAAIDDEEEDLINNILPSYQMFQSTISKPLDSSEEDYSREPPIYERTPISSATSLSAIHSPFSHTSAESLTEFPFPVPSQTENEQIEIWENTILANVHTLKNLSKTDSKLPKTLEIKVHVTSRVCQKGFKPQEVDPSEMEFKQGDFIHGYVTIENHSEEPLGFDMVYVVFEGVVMVLENEGGLIDTQKPKVVHKFLNMTDLFASWSFANIDRLTTDNGDPHDWCEGETDPYDNTILSLGLKKNFLPHVKYKRFFSFKVPERLLEDICEIHNLNSHTLLPSSLGFPKYSMRPSSLLSMKSDAVNDLCFLDTSISYSVECRIIGKAHDYGLALPKDQYVIASESIQPIRVVPLETPLYAQDTEEICRYYTAFIKSVTDVIDLGKGLFNSREAFSGMALSPVSSTDSKIRQLYKVGRDDNKKAYVDPNSCQFFDNVYQNIISYKKKTLLSSRDSSIISLSSPKTVYSIAYVSPTKFRKKEVDDKDVSLTVPLKLKLHQASPKSKPIVKSITVELIVGTLRSSKEHIPVEFTHDIFIRKDELRMLGAKTENECFVEEVTKPCHKYTKQIADLIEKVGASTMQVDRQLFHDVKCLGSLSSKFSSFVFREHSLTYEDGTGKGSTSDLNKIPWTSEDDSVSKTFNLHLNLQNCNSKVRGPKGSKFFDQVTLVPDSQTCFSVRLHYIKVSIKLTYGDSLVVKLPLKVMK